MATWASWPNPQGSKYQSPKSVAFNLWFLYEELQLWFGLYASYLGSWTLREYDADSGLLCRDLLLCPGPSNVITLLMMYIIGTPHA